MCAMQPNAHTINCACSGVSGATPIHTLFIHFFFFLILRRFVLIILFSLLCINALDSIRLVLVRVVLTRQCQLQWWASKNFLHFLFSLFCFTLLRRFFNEISSPLLRKFSFCFLKRIFHEFGVHLNVRKLEHNYSECYFCCFEFISNAVLSPQ